jgi:Xaa-Pro dipeptidase
MYRERIENLKTTMMSTNLELVAINAGPDLFFFTGMQFHVSERPVILVVGKIGEPAIFYPEFESEKVQSSHLHLSRFAYDENRSKWIARLSMLFDSLVTKRNKIGVNPTSFRFLETQLIQEAFPGLTITSAANIFTNLRQTKDTRELDFISASIQIAQKALENTLTFITKGKTEQEVANELVVQLLRAGSDSELPFSPIVAAGENSANPHAFPSDRQLRDGDLLLIDWGARYKGYVSDLTRTFAIGNVDEDFHKIHQIVRDANSSAREFTSDKVTSHLVDRAARKVILDAGYGALFTHRTGHGIGLETHEEPYIQEGSDTLLKSGMTFTIEPGIYLPGKGGIRIEDNVVVENDHLVTLTSFPRDLIVL